MPARELPALHSSRLCAVNDTTAELQGFSSVRCYTVPIRRGVRLNALKQS